MGLTDQLADLATERQIDLLGFDAYIRRDVRRLLTALEREIVARMANEALEARAEARMRSLLNDVRELIRSSYTSIDRLVLARMQALAGLEVDWSRVATQKIIGIDIFSATPSATQLRAIASDVLIQGAPSAEWWKRQAGDTVFRFSAAVRQGLAQSETIPQIVARIRGPVGFMQVSKRNAEALVRTSVQTVSAAARMALYRENETVVRGVQQVSTLDARTTDICIAYDGAAWDLDGKPLAGTSLPFNGGPPRHWNCRSTLVPVTRTWRDMGLDVDEFVPGSRAAVDGEIAAKATFSDWLSRRERSEPGFADRVLGVGRAQLWRDGKITLQQLLDRTGRPLTLDELRARSR